MTACLGFARQWALLCTIILCALLITPTVAEATLYYSLDDVTQQEICKWSAKPSFVRERRAHWERLAVLIGLADSIYATPEQGTAVRVSPSSADPAYAGFDAQAWRVVANTNQLDPGLYDPGGYAAALENQQTHEVILAIRGSDTFGDWDRNFAQDGLIGDQHNKIGDFVALVKSKFGARFTTIVGHSRGGQLAVYAAVISHKKAVTFNASVIPRQFFETARVKYGVDGVEIRNIYTKVTDGMLTISDFISSWSSMFSDGLVFGSIEGIEYENNLRAVWIDNGNHDFEITIRDMSWLGYSGPPGDDWGDSLDPTWSFRAFHSIKRMRLAAARLYLFYAKVSDSLGACR